MSTTLDTAAARPVVDVRALLLGDDGPAALHDALRDAVNAETADRTDGAPPRVARVLRRLADDRLAETAAGFLDVDLGAVAVAGWRRHRQLREAARETASDPGLTVLVELAEHRVSSRWRPRVDVIVNGTTLAHLAFELRVTLRMVALHAAVNGGRLTELAGGHGDLRAAFSLGGRTLVERRAPFDVRLAVRLGDGVPLLAAPPAPRPPRSMWSHVSDSSRSA
jgi:hypothetical protein